MKGNNHPPEQKVLRSHCTMRGLKLRFSGNLHESLVNVPVCPVKIMLVKKIQMQ